MNRPALSIRALKIIVIAMSLLILAGMGAVGYGMVRQAVLIAAPP